LNLSAARESRPGGRQLSRRRQSAFRGDVACTAERHTAFLFNSQCALFSLFLLLLLLSAARCLPSLFLPPIPSPRIFLSHFSARPCVLLSSPPSLRLTLFFSLSLSFSFFIRLDLSRVILLVAPAPGSRHDSPLRILRQRAAVLRDRSHRAVDTYRRTRCEREKERGIRGATFRNARSSPCVARVSAPHEE